MPPVEEKKQQANLAQALTAVLSTHAQNRGITDEERLRNVQTLGKLTKHHRAAKRVVKNQATLRSLMESMKNKPRFAKMVEYSIECMKNLAVDEVSVEEIIEEGGLETIQRMLHANPYNENIQQMVNRCVKQMCVNDRMATLTAEKFGAQAMVFSLRKHVDESTHVTTCQALNALMRDGKVVDKFVEDGVVEAIAAMMKNNPDNPEIASAASQALSRIAADPKHAARIMDSGVIESILNAIKKNPESAELAKNGCGLLSKLAAANPAIMQRLRDMGALDVIVAALEAHPDNKELLAIGASALSAMTGRSDVGLYIGHIVQGDRDWEKKAAALATVSSLALVEENVEHIVEIGGISAVINAMQSAAGEKNEINAKILESGCRILERLAVNENNIYAIMSAGGVKLIMGVIKQYMDNEKVLAAALGAMGAMCTRKENCDYICKVGGVEACLEAIRAHPSSARVAKQALAVLQRLCAHEEIVPAVVKAGGIEALVTIMKNHSGNPEIILSAINTLGRMAISAENLKAMAEAGALEVLIDVLKTHIDNPDICKQAMLLLESAALLPGNAELLRKLGAMEAILKAMEAHPDNEQLQQIGARAMAMIAGNKELVTAIKSVQSLVDQLKALGDADPHEIIAQLGPALTLLGNLALIETNIDSLVENGALATVLKALEVAYGLKPSADKEDLMIAALKTIARLATHAKNAALVVESGMLEKMLDYALAHPENEELAEHVAALVEKLAAHESVVPLLLSRGIHDKLIKLAELHPLNSAVLHSAAAALGCMSKGDGFAEILRKNGQAILVEAITNALDKPAVLLTAINTLAHLALDDNAVAALISAGAIDALIQAMRTHPDNADIQIACMSALGRLVVSAAVAREMADKGVLQLVTDAMRRHHTNEKLIEVAMALLDALALVPENARILAEDLGGLDLAKWTLETFPDNPSLVQITQRAAQLMQAALQAKEENKALQGEAIDPRLLISVLNDPEATNAALLSALGQVQQILDLEDPVLAQVFIENGGLEALARVLRTHQDNPVIYTAAAQAYEKLGRKAEKLLTPQVVGNLQSPLMVDALLDMIQPTKQMKDHVTVAHMIQACNLLATLAEKPENIEMIIKKGGIQQLLRMLSEAQDPELLEAAIKALAKLSGHDAAAALLGQNLKDLIDAMRRNMDKPEFLRYGAFLLGNLAVNEQIKSQIGLIGGINVIIQAMERYPQHAKLVENCDYALANLSFSNELNMSIIVASGGILAIINSMTNHPTAEELLDSATCALSNLCYKSDQNKELIVKMGGAKAIVDCVLGNFNNAGLLITGYRALGNLAFFVPNISLIIKEGGCQAIVAGMTVHANHLELIQVGLGVLTNLASDLDAENMTIMAQEGAVQAIVDVVKNHQDHAEVEVAALACLANLGREDYNAIMMVKQHLVAEMGSCMNKLSFDAELLTKACRVLNVISEVRVNVEPMLADQAGAHIAVALNIEKTNRVLLIDALRALYNLAPSEDFALQLGRQNVMAAALLVGNENTEHKSVLMEVWRTLGALCRAEPNASAMALKAMSQAERALQMHYRDGELVNFCASFLANLCVFPNAAQEVVQTELVITLLNATKHHLDNTLVAHRTLHALENIALSCNPVKDHMKAKGAVEMLQELHDKTPLAELKVAIKVVIDAINRRKGYKKVEEPQGGFKRAKDLFDDGKDKVEVKEDLIVELSLDVRNLLTAGALLLKHSNTAPPRPRHVFVTGDMKWLVWKDPKKAMKDMEDDETKKIRVNRIRTVETGRCTPQLKRKKWGKYLANEQQCFAIMGRERTVDLEAPSEGERDKWVKAILHWVNWHKAKKKIDSKF